MPLILGNSTFADNELLMMAIINRTPDSFYDKGASFAEAAAFDRVDEVIAQGAHIVDIGGVKAGPGQSVDAAEEIRRTATFVEAVRSRYPGIVISVDTWRAEVGRAALESGADVINDAWGGWDPQLAEVAGEFGAGIVCTHAGGTEPRTRPHRISYDNVTESVIDVTVGLAQRAVSLGVPRESVMIDPGHDFGKNTYHSLEVTRHLSQMTQTGWPVLVSLSNKDFVGETLDLPVGERLTGTLAVTALSAWQGARIFRVHNVAETAQTLAMTASVMGIRPPAVARRGLA